MLEFVNCTFREIGKENPENPQKVHMKSELLRKAINGPQAF